MKIFVTGATGFVGREFVTRAKDRGHKIAALVRSEASVKKIGPVADGIEAVEGTLFDPENLARAMRGSDAVVHLVGIIRETGGETFERVHVEGTRNVVEACRKAGIQRYLHMSAENTRPDAPDRYHTTKFEAEEIVRASGLDYTIFRPSMLFGRHDRNFNELAAIIRKAPVVPVIGDGEYVWQPVWVGDVTEIFLRALETADAVGKAYEIRGPEKFSYNEILDLLMEILGRRKPRIFTPVSLMKPLVSAMGLFQSIAPITPEQLKMLLDEIEPPPENFSDDIPVKLKRLEEGLREYLA